MRACTCAAMSPTVPSLIANIRTSYIGAFVHINAVDCFTCAVRVGTHCALALLIMPFCLILRVNSSLTHCVHPSPVEWPARYLSSLMLFCLQAIVRLMGASVSLCVCLFCISAVEWKQSADKPNAIGQPLVGCVCVSYLVQFSGISGPAAIRTKSHQTHTEFICVYVCERQFLPLGNCVNCACACQFSHIHAQTHMQAEHKFSMSSSPRHMQLTTIINPVGLHYARSKWSRVHTSTREIAHKHTQRRHTHYHVL